MTSNQIAFNQLEESRRSNRENERLKEQSNQITARHYEADEAIRSRQNDISEQANLITEGHYTRMDEETARKNRADEKIRKYSNVTERMNAETNSMNADTNRMNAITNQGNLAVNQMNAVTNRMNATTQQGMLNETIQHNRNVEAETSRHNKKGEQIDAYKAAAQETYWVDTVKNQAYINSANASYVQAQQSALNKKTESEVQKNKSEIEKNKSQTKLNEASTFEKKTKGAKNITDSGGKISQEIREWFGDLTRFNKLNSTNFIPIGGH